MSARDFPLSTPAPGEPGERALLLELLKRRPELKGQRFASFFVTGEGPTHPWRGQEVEEASGYVLTARGAGPNLHFRTAAQAHTAHVGDATQAQTFRACASSVAPRHRQRRRSSTPAARAVGRSPRLIVSILPSVIS
jgi:hypothetical protein